MIRFALIAGFFGFMTIAPTYALSEHQELKKENPFYYRDCPIYQSVIKVI